MNFVEKNYEMDPDTEVLINGLDLKNGMIVLIESEKLRFDPHSNRPEVLENLRQANRWAIVTRLVKPFYQDWPETENVYTDNGYILQLWTGGTVRSGPLLSFVAQYEDGSSYPRCYSTTHAWIVKKSSIPA